MPKWGRSRSDRADEQDNPAPPFIPPTTFWPTFSHFHEQLAGTERPRRRLAIFCWPGHSVSPNPRRRPKDK
uniref:Uncharacterized protein n=1 Tax=Bursaphelenchus xylophilus TaxID=6326 RepID=A0A1I7SVU2_BURXY